MPCHHLLCVTPEHSVTAAAAPFTPAGTPTPPAPGSRSSRSVPCSGRVSPVRPPCAASCVQRLSLSATRSRSVHTARAGPSLLVTAPCGTRRVAVIWVVPTAVHVCVSGESLGVSWEPTRGTAGPRDTVQPCVPETPGPAPGPRPAAGFPEAWWLRLAGAWRRRHRVTKAPPWTQSRRRRRLETPRSR